MYYTGLYDWGVWHDFSWFSFPQFALLNALFLENLPLPEGWRKTLPKSDHLWISQALFTAGTNKKAKLDWHRYACFFVMRAFLLHIGGFLWHSRAVLFWNFIQSWQVVVVPSWASPARSILCPEAPAMDAKKTMESNLELSPSRMWQATSDQHWYLQHRPASGRYR